MFSRLGAAPRSRNLPSGISLLPLVTTWFRTAYGLGRTELMAAESGHGIRPVVIPPHS